MTTNDYAVVVGINHYPGIGALKGPENDALAFKKWLLRQEGGNIRDDGEHLQLIVSSQFPEADSVFDAKPTTNEINNALTRLIRWGDEGGVS